MGTYIGKIQFGDSPELISLGDTLYGTCSTPAINQKKRIELPNLDRLLDGVQIRIKFINGNSATSHVSLIFINTLINEYEVVGDCTCDTNGIISFTWVEGNPSYWGVTENGISNNIKEYLNNQLLNIDLTSIDAADRTHTHGYIQNDGTLNTNNNSNCAVITNNIHEIIDADLTVENPIVPTEGQNTATAFIDSISQNSYGQISVTKKNVQIPLSRIIDDGRNRSIIINDDGQIISEDLSVSEPTVPINGQTNTAVAFIDSISQNSYGQIQVTKKNVSVPLSNIIDATHLQALEGLTNANNTGLLRRTTNEWQFIPWVESSTDKALTPNGTWENVVNSLNGHSGAITLADLGLANALHFKGIAVNTQLADGSSIDPFSEEDPVPEYTGGLDGDVVIDKFQLREYVWYERKWHLLGFATSTIYSSTPNDAGGISNSPSWIESITQYTDGRIEVTRKNMGILPISHGGTGIDSIDKDQVILSNNSGGNSATGFTSRAYTDNTNATNIDESSNNFITERSIYYGLPFINGLHNYTSLSQYYAPIESGQPNQILVSGTRSEHINGEDVSFTDPQWAAAATLVSNIGTFNNSNAFTILSLGSQGDQTYSQGKIILYASDIHTIEGKKTQVNMARNHTHILPQASGYLVTTNETTAVGSSTQPIYINSEGIATALTYIVKKLYYGTTETSFVASNHYINNQQLGINVDSWPTDAIGAPIDANLYVDGTTVINGILKITDTTDITTGNSATDGALIVSGGATINKKLQVQQTLTVAGNTDLNSLTVSNTTCLMNQVGIGTAPRTETGAPLLYVEGMSEFNGIVNMNNTLNIDGIVSITNNTLATSTTGALVVTGGIHTDANLYVDSTTSLLENVSIGTEVNNNNSSYILTIQGSTIIYGENTAAAYLDIITASNQDSLNFYPHVDGTGNIGLSETRWSNGYYSTLLQIGTDNNNDLDTGILLQSDGIITIKTTFQSSNTYMANFITLDTTSGMGKIEITDNQNKNSILLNTNINDTTANITITTEIPTFILETTKKNTSNIQYASWNLTNDTGVFTLTNNARNTVTLEGNDNGWQVFGQVGINIEPEQWPTNESDDPHILLINGSIGIYTPVSSPGESLLTAHLDTEITTISSINYGVLSFYPEADGYGSIGTNAHRWYDGYFSNTLTLKTENDNFIMLSVTPTTLGNNIQETGSITISTVIPTISLITTTTQRDTVIPEEAWIITNDAGQLLLSNQVSTTTTYLQGDDNGWKISGQVGINIEPETWPTNASTDPHILLINGSIGICSPNPSDQMGAHIDISSATISNTSVATVDFFPETTNTGNLGLPEVQGNDSHRWKALYLGTADTYGDDYTPIYWNEGVPQVTSVVQKYPFELNSTDSTVIILSNTYKSNTIVIQIVVEEGISYLKEPLSWSINNSGNIVIETQTNTDGLVTGYIITSTGLEIEEEEENSEVIS